MSDRLTELYFYTYYGDVKIFTDFDQYNFDVHFYDVDKEELVFDLAMYSDSLFKRCMIGGIYNNLEFAKVVFERRYQIPELYEHISNVFASNYIIDEELFTKYPFKYILPDSKLTEKQAERLWQYSPRAIEEASTYMGWKWGSTYVCHECYYLNCQCHNYPFLINYENMIDIEDKKDKKEMVKLNFEYNFVNNLLRGVYTFKVEPTFVDEKKIANNTMQALYFYFNSANEKLIKQCKHRFCNIGYRSEMILGKSFSANACIDYSFRASKEVLEAYDIEHLKLRIMSSSRMNHHFDEPYMELYQTAVKLKNIIAVQELYDLAVKKGYFLSYYTGEKVYNYTISEMEREMIKEDWYMHRIYHSSTYHDWTKHGYPENVESGITMSG